MSRHERDADEGRHRDGYPEREDRDLITGQSLSTSRHREEHGDEHDDDRYRFTLRNGQVTRLQEFDDGRWRRERIGRHETWTYSDGVLTQIERERRGIQTTTYRDQDNDGVFTRVTESFNPFSERTNMEPISG